MVKPTHLNPSYIAPSAWWEHVPLAHWLIETLQPNVVVELGSHYGVSFFAFCQAAKQLSPKSFVYAVDTWTGDEHAGSYEDAIYQQVLQHQRIHYSQNSALIRQSFDEALAYFADASVDLLHIDGLHTYDAVKHDFSTWQAKLTGNGTILFHDINVREREFGVWKLWHEIKQSDTFHCLEVAYGSGLGIATQGPDRPEWHQEFRREREDFQSRGALFLDLAGKHLALLEAHQANHNLSLELAAVKAELETMMHRTVSEAPQEPALASQKPAAGALPPIERGRLARLKTKLKAQSKQVLQRRHSLAALIDKAKRKGSRLIRLKQAAPPSGFESLKVVLISGEAHTPGHLYRVKRFAEAYAAIGASVTVLSPEEINTNLGTIAGSQILSLWRIAWSADLARAIEACRARGGHIVFDVDDLMIRPELAKAEVIDGIRSNRFDEAETAKLFGRMQQTMLAADICVTTTQELASQMRLFGKPVFVIPNGYDEPTFSTARLAYRQRQLQGASPTIRLGYASGSLTHQKDFSYCYAGVVSALRRHPNCRLVLFRDNNNTPCLDIKEFPELATLSDQIEWRQLVAIENLPTELARFDINIIPLETGNVFTESKSELKFFEAALAGVCSIASPTGPYRRIVRNEENGLLASTAEEWEQHLECLITNPELRRRYAQTALADTLFAYGPVHRTQQIATLATYLTRPAARGVLFQSLIRDETINQPPTTVEIPRFEVVLSNDQGRMASVTVVIPLFNYETYIVEALDSVKNQTLADIDLIVIDDRSTDASLAVARDWLGRNRSHFNRVILAKNSDNSKLGPTRNVGFHLAETEYVFALDADNRLAPECLERCVDLARARKPAYVYPTLEEFGATKGMIGNLEYTPLKLVGGNYIDAMALVSKAAWLHVGGYRNIRHGWEDYELWCRFAEAGLTAAHAGSVPLAYYRVHSESMLRTTTDTHDNKQELIGTMQRLHPWLQISTPPEAGSAVTGEILSQEPSTRHTDAGAPRRAINTLLPLLRCPATHEPLQLSDGKLSVAGRDDVNWPLVDGAPNLFAGLHDPVIMDAQHVSHPLPDHIQGKILETPGWVLNLSAGGSQQKQANVIEVEFALFRHTDVIADAHELPFAAETFEGIVCMNAFEHYYDPLKVASELHRVLKPGGWLVVRTAFLQPEHEYPWHFYNTTSEGLKRWFHNFDIETIHVSDNFNPLYALSWLAAQCEASLRSDASAAAADRFRNTPVNTLIEGWNQGRLEEGELWPSFQQLSQEKQRAIAAGFELLARKPADQAG